MQNVARRFLFVVGVFVSEDIGVFCRVDICELDSSSAILLRTTVK